MRWKILVFILLWITCNPQSRALMTHVQFDFRKHFIIKGHGWQWLRHSSEKTANKNMSHKWCRWKLFVTDTTTCGSFDVWTNQQWLEREKTLRPLACLDVTNNSRIQRLTNFAHNPLSWWCCDQASAHSELVTSLDIACLKKPQELNWRNVKLAWMTLETQQDSMVRWTKFNLMEREDRKSNKQGAGSNKRETVFGVSAPLHWQWKSWQQSPLSTLNQLFVLNVVCFINWSIWIGNDDWHSDTHENLKSILVHMSAKSAGALRLSFLST